MSKLIKRVFSLDLNSSRDSIDLISHGREFHIRGPATPKALDKAKDDDVGGTSKKR